MKERFIDKVIQPVVVTTSLVCVILICVLIYYNVLLGVVGTLLLSCALLYETHTSQERKKAFSNYIENLTSNMDATVKKNIVTNPLPICITDRKGSLEWYNTKFGELFSEKDLIYTNLHQLVPAFKVEEILNKKPGDPPKQVTIKDRIYKLILSDVGTDDSDDMLVIYFIDVTAFENLKKMHRDEKLCSAFIYVDNYEELMFRADANKKSMLASQIEVKILQFAQKNVSPIVKYDDDKYFLVIDNKHLEKIEEGKFSILDEVREIETDTDFPVSLSIGIGSAGKDFVQNHDFAQAAIDLAMGRGGDQAVVKKINKVDYYGGRLQTVEKRNKGKSRIMSHALQRLIEQSSKVIIMGHKNADMDAFGAAVGIQALAKKSNKPVSIVMDFVGESLVALYNYVKTNSKLNMISSEAALASIDKDSLLIVVDTHSPNYTECPDLLKKTEKIVVIDHHRKMEIGIYNPTLAYMESYASSTCELVTEIIQYAGDKSIIGKIEADALLAGITLDTKHFSTQSGVRTFEAASYLRRVGADTTKVRGFFQVDQELFRTKAKAILDAELINMGDSNIAVTKCTQIDDNIGLITAQTADEMLEIRGVRAAIVIGMNLKGEVMVSARSIGDVNVQVLMEKLGGGGHLNIAGAQLKGSLDEVEIKVKEIIYNDIKERSRK